MLLKLQNYNLNKIYLFIYFAMSQRRDREEMEKIFKLNIDAMNPVQNICEIKIMMQASNSSQALFFMEIRI